MSRKRRANVRYCESTDEENMDDADFQMDFDKSPCKTDDESPVVRKRGRGPSKRPCLNRNALMARENRLRKKAYLEKIESKLSFYQQENKTLTTTIQKQAIDIKRLSGEVAYLRSILNNNTSITALLRALNDALKKLHGSNSRKDLDDQAPALQRADRVDGQGIRSYYDAAKGNVIGNGLGHSLNGIQVPKLDAQTFSTAYSANSTYSTTTATANAKWLTNCKRSVGKKTAYSFTDTDHTYTALKDTTMTNVKREPLTTEAVDIFNSADNTSLNNHSRNSDYQNLMPITPISTPESDVKKESDKADMNLDQLPLFSMDIFDDLPKCEDMMSSVGSLQDTASLLGEDDLFSNLDDAGICLHLNSDKVSLEFCSICHMNSRHSEIE